MSAVEKVEEEIKKVEAKIEKVEAKIENEKDTEERKQLREEKKQLRDKEKQLREEKKQLNDRLNILLQQQQQQQPNKSPAKRPRIGSGFGDSPASKPTRSRVAIHKLTEYLRATKMKVYVDNAIVSEIRDDFVASRLIASAPPQDAENNVAAFLGITSFMKDFPATNLNFRLLTSQKEESFQKKHLQEEFFEKEGFKAIDKSNHSSDGPFFKAQHEAKMTVSGEYFIGCLRTGKPDGTSSAAPMDVEIKTDTSEQTTTTGLVYEAIFQAAERTLVRMQLYGYLKWAIGFAITNRSAWCLIVRRSEGVCNIHLFRILPESFEKLWFGVTACVAENPNHFLIDDGPTILRVLWTLGIPSWTCRVKLLAESASRVYAITKMGNFVWGKSEKTHGIPMDKNACFVFKVVDKATELKTENEALAKIMANSREPYAFGSVSFYEDPIVVKYKESDFNVFTSGLVGINQNSSAWWDSNGHIAGTNNNNAEHAGAILMRVGTAWEDHHSINDVAWGVAASLCSTHEAGLLQCDVRRANVLNFEPGGWTLIDYGLACAVDAGEYALADGAQRDNAGQRIQKCLEDGRAITWAIADDYEMLLGMILKESK